MRTDSSLVEDQRERAVALFELGLAVQAVATRLGVSRPSVDRLYQRWRVRGRGALVTKPTKQSYSFEIKLDLVQRFIAGETQTALAKEAGLSSPVLLRTWVRQYRAHGEDALRPKPKGRPAKQPGEAKEVPEVERLRREVEYLRAENAYLGKLRALMEQERRSE